MNKQLQLFEQEEENEPNLKGISVHGNFNHQSYSGYSRAVWIENKKPIIEISDIEGVSDIILTYLALIHAQKFCVESKLILPIYSSNRVAISWVLAKGNKINPLNYSPDVAQKLSNAKLWNATHNSLEVLKFWDVHKWGRIPGDIRKKKKHREIY